MRSASMKTPLGIAFLILFLCLTLAPASAGDIVFNINSGEDSDLFWVEGEPSLVMNGFDLSAYADDLPLAFDAVTIWAETPAFEVTVVVYEDANGGSPHDATLVYRQHAPIGGVGAIRVALDEPAIVQEQVAWIGFYLPVGFRFLADMSGSSPYTYWGWTPNGPIDLSSPGRAVVLGPGDGTEPVNLQMDGIARISAEARTATSLEVAYLTPLGQQVADDQEFDTSGFVEHANCPGMLYDPSDLDGFPASFPPLSCLVGSPVETPVDVLDSPQGMIDVQREGTLYKIVAAEARALPHPVTHCIRPNELHLEVAVLGEAVDIPERWQILPSVRYGDLVCAEVGFTNYVSYFLPRDGEAVQNVNLVVGWSKVDPHPLICGLYSHVSAAVVNTGREDFFTDGEDVQFSVENIHLDSNHIVEAVDRSFPAGEFQPGWRKALDMGSLVVTEAGMIGDRFRLQIRADTAYQVPEISETDNIWMTEYILRPISKDNRCDPKTIPPICDPENYQPFPRQGPRNPEGSDHKLYSSGYEYVVKPPPRDRGFGDGVYGYCSCLSAHYYPTNDCVDDYRKEWKDDLDLEFFERGGTVCDVHAMSKSVFVKCMTFIDELKPGAGSNPGNVWDQTSCLSDKTPNCP